MELIVEIINRSGRVLERRTLDGERITIGRAYDNSLILDDVSVDPHHISIDISGDGGFQLQDLASVNGLIYKNRNIKGEVSLQSGDEFVLGKTHLRIYNLNHPVEETVSLDSVDGVLNYLSKNIILVGAVLLATLLIALEIWNGAVAELKAQDFFETISILYIGAIAIALFWGLIGRVVKHEMFFKMQLSLILFYISLAVCIQFLYHVILFNTLNYPITTSTYALIECIFLAILFWLNLRIATNQANVQRWVSATILSVCIVLFSFSAEFFARINHSNSPYFVSSLKPPSLRVASATNLDDFLRKGEAIYSHKIEE
ncbi:MAG: FHA domain-containing protein [Gammaproteobacteria bacterium]